MGAKPEKEPIGRPLFGYVLERDMCNSAVEASSHHFETIIIVDYSILLTVNYKFLQP